MIVDIFIPCYIDQFFPEVANNMIKVLERLGCGVNYNPEQTCCGQPAFENGYWDHCKEVGEKLIHEFQDERYIVAPASSCVSTIKNSYVTLFHNTALHNEYKSVQKHIYEFSDFLVNVLHVTDVGATLNATATFHDACNALRELKIKDAPRTLLSKVKGLNLVEMDEAEACCGFGGNMSYKFEKLAVGLANEKIRSVEKTKAEYIISTDMNCLMHINGVLAKSGNPLKVIHIADVLANGWE